MSGAIDPIRPVREPLLRVPRERDEDPRERRHEEPAQEDEARREPAPEDGLPHIDIRA